MDLWTWGNFLAQVYVENAKNSFCTDISDNYDIFFWECELTMTSTLWFGYKNDAWAGS